MKKLFATLLAFAMLLALTACGGAKDTKESASAAPASGSGTSSPAAENTPASAPEPAPEPAAAAETVEEQVLLDERGIKITLKSLDKDALFGPELKMLFENESGKNITVQVRNLSVNGYMIDDMMSVDVVDGKKANDELTLMSSDLESAGISTIADVEFSFHIYDSGTWDEVVDSEPVVIRTSAADGYEYTFDDSGDVVYEDDNMKIVVKELSTESGIFGPSLIFYVENKSDIDFTVQARDTSVNGYMIDAMCSSDVIAGKHCVDSVTFMSSDLEKNGITQIESVELSFHVFTTDGWDTMVDTETITLNF